MEFPPVPLPLLVAVVEPPPCEEAPPIEAPPLLALLPPLPLLVLEALAVVAVEPLSSPQATSVALAKMPHQRAVRSDECT